MNLKETKILSLFRQDKRGTTRISIDSYQICVTDDASGYALSLVFSIVGKDRANKIRDAILRLNNTLFGNSPIKIEALKQICYYHTAHVRPRELSSVRSTTLVYQFDVVLTFSIASSHPYDFFENYLNESISLPKTMCILGKRMDG